MEKASPLIEVKPDNVNPPITAVNLNVSTDAIIITAVILWSIWDKIIKPFTTKKIEKLFSPVEEERRITNILAQIGIITKASRVILAAFHNGSLDSAGYHLQKLSTVNFYTAPGSSPMNIPIRDLPVGRIMYEIEEMLKTDNWTCVVYHDDLPQPCKDHLLRNDMKKMCNRLVKAGNLPIGILSIQYTYDQKKCDPYQIIEPQYQSLMDDLYMEISTIMRRRLIYPSPIHKVFGKYLGTLTVKK